MAITNQSKNPIKFVKKIASNQDINETSLAGFTKGSVSSNKTIGGYPGAAQLLAQTKAE